MVSGPYLSYFLLHALLLVHLDYLAGDALDLVSELGHRAQRHHALQDLGRPLSPQHFLQQLPVKGTPGKPLKETRARDASTQTYYSS